jgi:hypothetical protein
MRKKPKERAQQPALLTPGDVYLWIPVRLLERNDTIVVANVEVKVQNMEHRDSEWHVTYLDPITRSRTEQLYNGHDQVYIKATNTIRARLNPTK